MTLPPWLRLLLWPASIIYGDLARLRARLYAGFQHLPLFRDVNILLMAASQPLGRESLLPAGNLREPVSAMDRADLLVVTRLEASPATLATIEELRDYPVFSAVTRLLGFRRLGQGIALLSFDEIGAGPFYAFCAIGNPKAFFHD